MIGLAFFVFKNNLPEVEFGEWLITLSDNMSNGTEEDVIKYQKLFSQTTANKKREALLKIQQFLRNQLMEHYTK